MTRRSILALVPALAAAGLVHAGGPANDDCSTPTVLVGEGFFPFDTTFATTGAEGQGLCPDPGGGEFANDVWFCWTATCTGIVTIETCGLTQLDTRIALWDDCGCPAQGVVPICCADNECGLQTRLVCEVVCGRTYTIQLGQRPDGLAGGVGELLIQCEGEPCPPPPGGGDCAAVAGQCCFGPPAYEAPDFQAFGAGGPVAFMTASPGVIGNQVLTAYDYSDFSSAVDGSNFPAARYSAPNWTGTELGSIFGITLDADGDVYVTPTITYVFDQVGIGTLGDVYRVDRTTGAVSVFTTSPLPNAGSGLGNIVYDCANDQFFVTNFEDGLIYRLDAAGNVLSTFDHGAPDDGTAGIAPLGDRPWGITVHDGRVYYGVWTEDQGRPNAAAANEVWSVALVAGDFSGAATLEVSLPGLGGASWSNPPSDLRFGPDGRLYVAERSMTDDSTPGAHASRLLEYACADGTWTPGAAYLVGVIAGDASCAGGVDVDFSDGGRIWSTADAIQFTPDTIYGAQGLPDGGGGPADSILIDYQGNLDNQDKTSIGDIAISCPQPCGDLVVKEIECLVGPDGFQDSYSATITVTNNSGVPVRYLLFPGPHVTPNVYALEDDLADGDSVQLPITFTGLAPGSIHCLQVVFADANVDECCTLEFCFETPECDCLIFEQKEVDCDAAGNVVVTIPFQHLAPYVAEHAFLIVESPAGATVTPEYVDLASIPQYGFGSVGPLTIGNLPDDATEICIRLTTHAENLIDCCSEVTCVPVPDCASGVRGGADLDGDGQVAFSDLVILLSSWGPCPGTPCLGDLDGSGTVDFADLVALLSAWTG